MSWIWWLVAVCVYLVIGWMMARSRWCHREPDGIIWPILLIWRIFDLVGLLFVEVFSLVRLLFVGVFKAIKAAFEYLTF